ncbi:hypothetical protein TNCV_1363571 [Trichonephila clavipes]|uniref:Uncharacterized protein n=1 Tax=Trichonephila clavipes TaxID=2585209 RepID=A0A8X6S2R1_TRICX|nr:hypothetical protein TNCV_1363571 [Trichonephila clavipes]
MGVAALSLDTGKVVVKKCHHIVPPAERFLKCLKVLDLKHLKQIMCVPSNFHVSRWCANRIFQCSIVKRCLKYAHYYGGSASKGFISVKDAYRKDSVTKYE